MADPAVSAPDDGTIFHKLFLAHPDALLLVDRDGVIRLANPGAADLLGYAESELIGLSVDELVPEADRQAHVSRREQYVANPRPKPMNMGMAVAARRRNGSEVMVEVTLSSLEDRGVLYVLTAVRGVDRYPRVQQALQRARYAESLARLGRDAVDAMHSSRVADMVPRLAADALQVETAKLLLLDADEQAFHVAAGVGLSPGEGVGQRVAALPGPDGSQDTQQPASPAGGVQERRWSEPGAGSESHTVREISVPLIDRGQTIGMFVVRLRGTQVFGEDERHFLQSLTSTLVTVLQRERTEQALNHAQRLESIGRLTGGVAHDFNNLLAVISGALQRMEALPEHANNASLQRLVGDARRAADRAADLTGKLLAFSRKQMLQPAVVDVAALLGSLSQVLRRTFKQNIAIQVDAEQVWCQADPIRLESALLNVAINARDAMQQGGSITMACRAVQALPDGLVAEGGPPPGDGFVAISIKDTGQGLSEAARKRAFEPFFTTKEAGHGTGLGLSSVYGFVKQSGGAISLQSTPGIGTTVTIYLPCMDPARMERVKDDLPADGAAGSGPPILLDDDL